MLVADWFGSFSNLNIFHLNNFFFSKRVVLFLFHLMSVLFSDREFCFLQFIFISFCVCFNYLCKFWAFFFNGWDFFLFCTKQRKAVLDLFNTEIVPLAKFSYEKISVSTILTQDIHIREFNKRKATFLGSIFSNILTAIPHLKITSFQVSLISKLNRRKAMGPW